MSYDPVLLANANKLDSHTLAVYQAGGGYQGLRRAVKMMSPGDIVELVKQSGLRRPRRGGLPDRHEMVVPPEDRPGPVYLCVNADESEPGTFVNRVQMEIDPHRYSKASY